jgi:ATP-dependent DNA ligase
MTRPTGTAVLRGIVSKKVDRTYRSGLSRAWIKVRNPTSIAVQRERSEKWNM